MFINFSNHPSEAWGKTQLNAAMEYGEVIDIPFPAVNPYSNEVCGTDYEFKSVLCVMSG